MIDVLVTDGFFRKSLAAVRGLAGAGLAVAAAERIRAAPALASRAAAARLVHPDPILDPDGFAVRIARFVRDAGIRVLLPMEETTLLALLERRRSLPRDAKLYFAPPDVIRDLTDKRIASRLLARAGFPVPETTEDPERVPLPAVVKPPSASGAVGVVKVETREAAVAAFSRVRAEYGAALAQEYVPGHGVGVSLLVTREGDAAAAFAHRRIRENPATGGASTLRESALLPDGWRDLASVLHGAGFFGPVNVECRRDERDGALRPIEINPRYWGSLALPIRAGVNFPALHYRLARGERPPPVTEYPIGVRCRWLLPGDLLSVAGLVRLGRFREALRALDPRGPFDILSAADPGPAFARLAAPAVMLAAPGLRKLLSRSSKAGIIPPTGC